jgi:hypothetical protein
MPKRDLAPLLLTLASLAGASLNAGCCVTPPNEEEILGLGFRSPEQTFATFQAGYRGDLPRLEFRCLSVDFRAREGLSQWAYREFRDRELSAKPWFKKGVSDAEVIYSQPVSQLRHVLIAESHGYQMELGLVREDIWQMWSGEEQLVDEELGSGGFRSYVDILEDSPTIIAGVDLPANIALLPKDDLRRGMTEVRFAQEWKIDSIRELTGDEKYVPPAETQPPSP